MHIFYQFPGNRNKALNFSIDDGVLEDEHMVAIFNRYGIKGSFNLNSCQDDYPTRIRLSRENIDRIYAGHEIACHTEYHPPLDMISRSEVIREMFGDRQRLEAASGRMITGFVYPNGHCSPALAEIALAAGFEYARTTHSQRELWYVPQDFFFWSPTCHYLEAPEFVEPFLCETRQLLTLFCIWGHSYEPEKNHQWDLIEKLCAKLGNRDDVWYATSLEICRYVKAIRSLIFSADGKTVFNPSAVTVCFRTGGWEVKECINIAPGETVTV